MANEPQAKGISFFARFVLIFLPFLGGCAALPAVVGSLGATEVMGARATKNMGYVPTTGDYLRESSYLSAPPERVDVPIYVRYTMETSWECFRGRNDYIGQRLCLRPGEASRLENSSEYLCKKGLSGGSVTTTVAPPEFQRTWFCKVHTAPSQAYSQN